MALNSVYDNGGIIGQVMDLGSTEQYITGPTPSLVGTATGTSTLSLTGITGLQEDDLVVIFAADDISCTLSSTGWTTLAQTTVNSVAHVVAYKVMGATPDTSVAFGGTNASTATAWRGVEYDSIGTVVQNGVNTTIDPSSISVTLDNSVALVLAGLDDQASASVSTAPTGYTVGPTAFGDGGCAQLYKTGVSAGTEDPSTLTWSASDAVISYTLLLKPIVSFGNLKNSGIWSLNAVYNSLY